MARAKRPTDFDYDVTLSFAGEERQYVEQVAKRLAALGIRVFYDRHEEVDLWGKDLYVHLSDLYRNSARYCVMFISKHYARKLWPSHERKSAQERAFRENKEYILPARFDATSVPGLLDTVGYIALADKRPGQLATMIASKVVELPRQNYFPVNADVLATRLRKEMKLRSDSSVKSNVDTAHRFYRMLTRMTAQERELIFKIVLLGCVAELPDNVHLDMEILRRVSGFSRGRVERVAEAISPLGFKITLRPRHHGKAKPPSNPSIVLRWNDLTMSAPRHPTWVMAVTISAAVDGHCEECGIDALNRMDFSQLSSKTAFKDVHLRAKTRHRN